MRGEARIVHDVRSLIVPLAKIAGSYHARRGDQITPSPLAGEGGGRDGGFEPHAASPASGSGVQAGTRTASEGYTGFSKAAKLNDIRKHGHILTPGRYIGAAAAEDDGEPFEDKMKQLSAELTKQLAEGAKLDEAIRANLAALGFPMENEP